MAMTQEAQRYGAFAAFDLDGTGAITQHDLPYAFQACAEVGELVSSEDMLVALRKAHYQPGSLITFPLFCHMCDIVAELVRPAREARLLASELAEREQEEELRYAQTSPRRTTRSVPLASSWEERAEDFPYLAGPVAAVPPADLPASPRGPRACLDDVPGMDPIAHAFYTFDLDFSGAISGCELPRMLRLVPRRSGPGTLARPGEAKGAGGGDGKALRKAQERWDDRVRQCLAVLGKEPSDLINLHEFQSVVDQLDPPPPPQPPQQPGDDGYETTESEKERRREAEEMRQRMEEAKKSWEKMMSTTLVVKVGEGNDYIKLLCCDPEDKVSQVLRRIAEQPGHPLSGRDPETTRLVGRGFDMDKRKSLQHYGVQVGAPWKMIPEGPAGPAGGPFGWKNGDILACTVRSAPPPELPPAVISGWLQLMLWDGRRHQVLCEEDEPMEHIMRRLAPEIGVPPTQQRFVVLGRELNPRKCLKDYKVALGAEGDVVDVMLRAAPAEPGYAGSLSPRR
eukprot:TRINITY_DN2061_c0_g1_i1.p1 TRINITY_DN2061_c0_g1~~TRINITY_DN2061_c0_g1_i1.p1  ORF type:complete len:528 (+),score=161.29 TRINITY_DN2061_c0_g1_i1:57-1586(+)